MAAKKAMDGSDDPDVINNNVYVLSETKIDLPFAKRQSRRSVDLLEKATASHALEEANTKAFAESANRTASWDTLGYILLLESKPKEAEPYLRAAWFSQQNVIVGNHLAQAFEGLDCNADALWIYRLAKQAEHAADAKQDFAKVAAAIARLEKAGVGQGSQRGALCYIDAGLSQLPREEWRGCGGWRHGTSPVERRWYRGSYARLR